MKLPILMPDGDTLLDVTGRVVIPVIAEELLVETRTVITGTVRVHKTVEEHEETVNPTLTRETVTVQTVEVNRTVEGPPPANCQDGDTLIIPVAVIPIVAEELVVGKRQVSGGGIRVYTQVTVERRPVDRAVSAADMASALQAQTLDVTTMGEEAVVFKRARVVEEVTIGKEASEWVETVHDTVRRTDVDVERMEGPSSTTTTRGSSH